MSLTEPIQGVYQFEPGLEKPSEMPIIAVHPFYFDLFKTEVGGKAIENPYRIFSDFRAETGIIGRLLGRKGEDAGIDEIHGPGENYKENLERLVSGRNSAVFVLDSAERLNRVTIPAFEKFTEKKGRYFIPTRSPFGEGYPDSPDPSRIREPAWKNFADFVRQFGQEVGIAGGELRRAGRSGYSGCASLVYYELKKRGLIPRFVRGCCFGD